VTTRKFSIATKAQFMGIAGLSLVSVGRLALGCDLDEVHSYAIDANRLSETLLFISRTSGCLVAFKPTSTHDFFSQAINGEMSVQHAMDLALIRSDLEAVQLANGSLTIRKRSGPRQAQP